jgi:hypothetical protein
MKNLEYPSIRRSAPIVMPGKARESYPRKVTAGKGHTQQSQFETSGHLIIH